MMGDDKVLGIIAIVCITILESVNLLCGHNGALLTLSIATVSGLAGFLLPSPKEIKQKILRG